MACAVAVVLTKEVMIVPLAGLAILGTPSEPWRRRGTLVGIPGAVLGGWALYVRLRVGRPAREGPYVGPPAVGYLRIWRHDPRYATDPVSQLLAIGLFVMAVATIGLWLHRRTITSSAGLPMAIVVLRFAPDVVGRYNNSLRAAAPLLTLVALDLYVRSSTPLPHKVSNL